MAIQLESLQRAFAEALHDAEHELPLLAHAKPVPLPEEFKSANTAAGEASDSAMLRRRLGLYRGNVRAQWRAALADAYPVLLTLVGDEYFDRLSLAYAREHPSQSGDLHRFGAELPAFIERYELDPRFRYFADVAHPEWSLHTAYFASDVVPLTPQQWMEIGEERLLDMPLAIHPACTAIASNYAIADIWFAHQPHGIFPECLDASTRVLTVRPLWRPTILVHSDAGHAAFIALLRGKPLSEALDSAFALDAKFDFASQWQAWISARAITGVSQGS